ncbi:DUF979 domain-containing protein [Cobetia sp. 4B]|uniref:DUF979 domain-containing protein n=1 Tax=Cobetia sp. 4B TaxID=2758724 RepID=UPI001C0552FD|nr:DUF979 domain-containing protein [Cobetia sp. 4B]MBR9753718.1 DUF979 domain-containing protein [Gammaproteobacteria bacterium]MBR9797721.1 DUF979 domain-containing protein [Gammaproteobacteria bacterium]QWN37772.1 DUF979 domain-containing protein [Cobetia sp. 4B]
MNGIDALYLITGFAIMAFAVLTLTDRDHPRRLGTSAFWMIFGISLAFGQWLPDVAVGLAMLALALLAATGQLGFGNYGQLSDEARQARRKRLGSRLFIPALVIPVGTFLYTLTTGQSALVGLGVATVLAFAVALLLLRESPATGMQEGRRLADAIGWAAILPQFLAALGLLFDQAGVGQTIAGLVSSVVPDTSLIACVIAYCVGMAVFTMLMGNGFAAFAVITSGIGYPLVIALHGGNPAIVGVLGMLSGYCGTLMTPMAANFNIVPAALLELDDRYHIIRAQILPALVMLAANISLMLLLAF